MVEAIISFVVEHISSLSKDYPHILNQVSDQVEQVVHKLKGFLPFLKDANSMHKDERVRIWTADLRTLVYDVEDVVESFVVKSSSGGCLCGNKIVKEMKAILKRMDELIARLQDYNIRSVGDTSSYNYEMPGKLQRFYSHVIVEPQVVGLQHDVESLVAHLVDESESSYRVVSICGMGGLGKTTLAKKIYNHSAIKAHFDGLAWVSLSQNWQLRNVVQRIVFCIVHDEKKRKEIMKLEDVQLLQYLHEIQRSTKCLVVVDDIWTNDAWDCLKPAFPTQEFKSKLMLTSRNVQVSHHVDPKAFLHRPQLLNDEQSWDLLKMKAIPKGTSLDARDVDKVEEFGREMVRHCGGLPLAIVVLAGILVTKQTWMAWEFVHREIQSSIKSGKGMGEVHEREVREILAWSYNNLPYQLKPCFLYLGRFGEDVEINTETLYQLWIAEGFILSSDQRVDQGETLMEVAESYLAELVHKSMVGVKLEEKESSLRMFGSCKLHDLMRDLALSKAKEEDLFNILDLRQVDNVANHHGGLQLMKSTYTRRLDFFYDGSDVICSKDIRLVKEASRGLRSVLWFNEDDGGWNTKVSPPILTLKLVNFRLLRVLSFEGFDIVDDDDDKIMDCIRFVRMNNKLPKALAGLIHLRYLSLRDTILLFFPSFIQNLEQLRTLDLRLSDDVIRFPWARRNAILKMRQLRHLYLPDVSINWNLRNKLEFDGVSKLETVENFDTEWCQVKDLHKLSNLRKLKMTIAGVDSDEVEEVVHYLESKASSCLRYLSLQISDFREYNSSLWKQLFGCNQVEIEGLIGEIPTTLDIITTGIITDLSLTNTGLEEDPMKVLEKLPALRRLELRRDSFNGNEMVCSAMGFPQLKLLRLEILRNLKKWRLEQGCMPSLSELEIIDCECLEELPEGLKFINSLQSLTTGSMPYYFNDKVRGADSYKVAHVPSITLG